MSKISIPRKPCSSCPYRKDVPSGVWDASEYAKLPLYDAPTHAQPTKVFMCHQQTGGLCRGWLDCHGVDHSLSLRLAVAMDEIELDAIYEASAEGPQVPVFSSGQDAAAHGLAELEKPSRAAKTVMTKLVRKRTRRQRDQNK